MPKTLWFLDYDGSVCPHQEIWEPRKYSSDDILTTVKHLAEQTQGVYWNTGRRVKSLESVNPGFLSFPGFFVHGSIFWSPESKKETILARTLDTSFVNWIEKKIEGEKNWLRLEVKPTALRITPLKLEKIFEVEEFLKKLTLPGAGQDWHWQFGPRGAEFLLKNFNKGTALQKGLAESKNPLALPVVVGDDFQDSYAVREALRRNGHALLVGENCGWITEIPHKPDQVHFFESASDVLDFFKSL